MKKLIGFLILIVAFTACQKKQYTDKGPEIDLVKSVDDAFLKADFVAYKAAYSDTASVWFNDWNGADTSLDSLVSALQRARSNYSDLKINMPVYEMVITDAGDQWVHRWCKWEATLKNGKSVAWPSHASFLVSAGKIRGAGYIFNALPGYLANQDSTASK